MADSVHSRYYVQEKIKFVVFLTLGNFSSGAGAQKLETQ